MDKLLDLGLDSVSASSTVARRVRLLILAAAVVGCVLQHDAQIAALQISQREQSIHESPTCTTDDLEHSVLVECNLTTCPRVPLLNGAGKGGAHNIEWPSQTGQIIHVYSTRAGERFTQVKVPNLDFREDDQARMFDINTTLYVNTAKNLAWDDEQRRKLVGFGATIDFMDLERALQDDQFQRVFELIFDDLFGGTDSSASVSFLRLQIEPKQNEQQNFLAFLLKLDNQIEKMAAGSESGPKLKLMLDFLGPIDGDWRLKLNSNISQSLMKIEIWAISISEITLRRDRDPAMYGNIIRRIRETLPNVPLFISVLPLYAPYLAIDINEIPMSDVQGLLIRSDSSVPYNYLGQVRQHAKPGVSIIVAGRASRRTKNLGDWKNAEECAIELMNHLRYGSNGYIEDKSVVDVLYDPAGLSDASLYSLHQDHGLHMRGPKFYAMGHFSRYLKGGSLPLETELFTQPNMFAAHYSAFLSADKRYIIGIIVNNNEHLLPFRMAVDRQIKVATHLKAKSFNTFVIKLTNNQ